VVNQTNSYLLPRFGAISVSMEVKMMTLRIFNRQIKWHKLNKKHV